MAHRTLTTLLPRLVSSGVVPASQRDRLRSVLSDIATLRDAVFPWIAMVAVLATVLLISMPHDVPHELAWKQTHSAGTGLGFGAWWYLYVGRTIFLTLLLAWLWRLVLMFVLLRRIAGLELSLV